MLDTISSLSIFQPFSQRVVLLDSDMLIKQNMDELFDFPLNPGWVAAAHACACNPRKLAHYPKDWFADNYMI